MTTEKKTYIVSYQRDEFCPFCTNLAIAESESDVETHYEQRFDGIRCLSVREAKEHEIEPLKRRGCPVVECGRAERETAAEQVEKDIDGAGYAAREIAQRAIAECALWWTSREMRADEGTVNWYYGRYQGLAGSLGLVLGYETEDAYTDMHSAMHDYLVREGKALARRNMEDAA